jgi:hypothetical protein
MMHCPRARRFENQPVTKAGSGQRPRHRAEGTHRSVFAGMDDLLGSPGYRVASRPVADGGTPTVFRESTPSKTARVTESSSSSGATLGGGLAQVRIQD